MEQIKVTKCNNCPFLHQLWDRDLGHDEYYCALQGHFFLEIGDRSIGSENQLPTYFDDFREEDIVETPEWCPLKHYKEIDIKWEEDDNK